MPNIILASASPRRAELLRRVGLDKIRLAAPRAEERIEPGTPPEEAVAYWSREKAAIVAPQFAPEDIIIAADTIVWFDGHILGKPADKADAFKTLTLLSGHWHWVYTGVTVMRGGDTLTETESTKVLMRPLTGPQIEAYIETGDPMDKAGAYGIQNHGALLVKRIDGDFYNVMGLPLYRLSVMLTQFGVNLLEVES